MKYKVGDRVVRSKDWLWCYGSQDYDASGKPTAGTITKAIVTKRERIYEIKWDNGHTFRYGCSNIKKCSAQMELFNDV